MNSILIRLVKFTVLKSSASVYNFQEVILSDVRINSIQFNILLERAQQRRDPNYKHAVQYIINILEITNIKTESLRTIYSRVVAYI